MVPVYKITIEINSSHLVNLPDYETIVIGTRFCKPNRGVIYKSSIDNESPNYIKSSLLKNSLTDGLNCAEKWVKATGLDIENLAINGEIFGMDGYYFKSISIAPVQKDNFCRYILLIIVITYFHIILNSNKPTDSRVGLNT